MVVYKPGRLYELDTEEMREDRRVITHALNEITRAWQEAQMTAQRRGKGKRGPLKAIERSRKAVGGIEMVLNNLDPCDYVSTQQVLSIAMEELMRLPDSYDPREYPFTRKKVVKAVSTVLDRLPRYLEKRYTTLCRCRFDEKEYPYSQVEDYVRRGTDKFRRAIMRW